MINDEAIIDLMTSMEEAEELNNLEVSDNCNESNTNSLYINGDNYNFIETDIYGGLIKIFMPSEFIDMPEAARKVKYLSENRPQIIKCNILGNVTLTFNMVDSPLDNESVRDLTEEMKELVKRLNSGNVFFNLDIIDVNEKNIGFFDYKSTALDDFIYNIMFFLEVNEKTLMGTFSCIYRDCDAWRDIALGMIRTIKVKND